MSTIEEAIDELENTLTEAREELRELRRLIKIGIAPEPNNDPAVKIETTETGEKKIVYVG